SIIWKKASYIQALIEELNLTYKLKNKLFLVNKSKTNMVNLLLKYLFLYPLLEYICYYLFHILKYQP
ncbi:hypothetical protein FC755_14970, partial [Clostridium sporogenes]|nr:hypothetical protein [Clostridium sporogenes]